ncbi:hypothetical protein IV102_29240 [bacterium]|nr:hypothetical protein [bacterium]
MSSTPMPLPDNEAERLASLLNMQVLDTPAETHLNVSVGVASLRGPTDRPREALARAEKAERSSDAGGVVLSI